MFIGREKPSVPFVAIGPVSRDCMRFKHCGVKIKRHCTQETFRVQLCRQLLEFVKVLSSFVPMYVCMYTSLHTMYACTYVCQQTNNVGHEQV